MGKAALQVKYNPLIFRWEVRTPGESLPEITHPSRDQAIALAFHLLRRERRAQLLVFDDRDRLESEMQLSNYPHEAAGAAVVASRTDPSFKPAAREKTARAR